ncbi:DUF421 domain-containing protein [Neobacillus muris]|uniref:DUF421 domain-containing protein n=1 Tax=Neobacillus muris TaxID=2941334 RepID=UPI00203D2F5C|nr:DUF421 domain-containing protein [Neobacillus muris]
MYKDLALELIVGFVALLLVLKLLGRLQFSQITPFDFITGMVMGNLVGDAAFDEKTGLGEILFSIAIWGLLIYCVELLTQKSAFLRSFLEGTPSFLVYKGRIVYKNIKKNKMDLNEFQQLMRKKGYFSIYEAEYVILERDGEISVVPKHKYGAPTKQDLSIPAKPVNLPIAVILDGNLVEQNLKETGHNEEWLKDQLSKKNIKNYKEIFYAEWQEDRGLQISTYNN